MLDLTQDRIRLEKLQSMRTQSLKKLDSPTAYVSNNTISIVALGSGHRNPVYDEEHQNSIYDKMMNYSQKKIRDNLNLTRKLSR